MRAAIRTLTPVTKRASRSTNNARMFSQAHSGEPKEGAVKFEVTRPFVGHRLGDKVPSNEVYATKDELIGMYRTMAYFRRFEIVADTLYKQRLIRGFCHLYDGQEAVVVGMEAAIEPTDSVITSYRDHCHQISRGVSGDAVMAELLGKETGSSKGRGGSMHMYSAKNKMYGGNGIVGAQVPLGAGLAFAHHYNKDKGCALAFYGDGASNQGQLFEAANMSALWKLPMIFVCENNQYGMGTSTARHCAAPNFYSRGDHIPGLWADGMDVLASKRAFEFCADYARNGNGPIFLEMSTYRYHGHSMSDPGISYRTRDEVDSVRKEKDPLDAAKKRIIAQEWATPAELKKMDKAIRKEVDAHVAFSKESRELTFDELTSDIYYKELPPFVRLVDNADSLRHRSKY